ncbi:plakophilin-1 [Esox lucius]|uniref:Plakophilin 1b n=1 Tax=Esox lucius TaxID=8010 RepID=A0A3P8Z150_ESOLU|nr:plakophilin-1 [Esox lucius]
MSFMTMDPLKSAISIGNVDETSLALPSDNQLRSKQQRVLDQVQTMKRGKSKYGKNGSLSSPTSPQNINIFSESVKSSSNLNGNAFFNVSAGHNTLSKTLIKEQNTEGLRVTASKGSTIKRIEGGTRQWKRHTIAMGQNNSSRSVPELGRNPASTLPAQRSKPAGWQTQPYRSSIILADSGRGPVLTNGFSQGTFISNELHPKSRKIIGTKSSQVTSTQFPNEMVSSSLSVGESKNIKSKSDFGMNNNGQIADITMKEAVEYLSSGDVNYQHCGASFIQHSTFTEEKAKQEVLRFKGIPPLVNLLKSTSPQVQQTASAALRNLAFKDPDNKEEIQRCGGITEVLTLLRETNCSETQKQLTGLLWNLSSADSLKPELVRCALPVLMDTVIVPYTAGMGETSNQDPELFYHATACLRNLSCAKQGNRQAMRNCRGFIDSLVSYVQGCVDADKPDDKSVENCVCVLHNLSFQLENEAPTLFSKINALAKTTSRANAHGDVGPIGCFSPQSSKVLEQENHFDFPVMEDPNPKGAGWLFHSKTIESYLSLLGSSQRDDTLEACCGALQNLTASPGIVSSVISQSIVRKLNGLPQISPLLQSSNLGLQKTAVALVGNLTKNPGLQSKIARQTLPDLVGILHSLSKEETDSDDTLAMACQTCHSLLIKEPEMGKNLLTNTVVNTLNDLSKNRQLPKASKAAGVLLYGLWSEKDIQSFLKKQGMNKSSFVNDITSVAHRSVQVIE